MTRLNKIQKLEDRIAPSMFAFGGNFHLGSNINANVNGHSLAQVDTQASANVNASAHSGGWVHPALIGATVQTGLESTIDLIPGVLKY